MTPATITTVAIDGLSLHIISDVSLLAEMKSILQLWVIGLYSNQDTCIPLHQTLLQFAYDKDVYVTRAYVQCAKCVVLLVHTID